MITLIGQENAPECPGVAPITHARQGPIRFLPMKSPPFSPSDTLIIRSKLKVL